jgi:hypothetical protein
VNAVKVLIMSNWQGERSLTQIGRQSISYGVSKKRHNVLLRWLTWRKASARGSSYVDEESKKPLSSPLMVKYYPQ